MTHYGRFDVIRYGSYFVITDMQTHNWVSATTDDRDQVHREAQRLQDLTDKVPESALPFFIRMLEQSAMIEAPDLRQQVRTIIDTAAENGNEYVEDEPAIHGNDWVDAFMGTVEVECEESPSADVRQWFAGQCSAKTTPARDLIRLPVRFFSDHQDRGLPTPRDHRKDARYAWVRPDDPALPYLLDDARYYAHKHGPDLAPRGVTMSAKATVRVIERALPKLTAQTQPKPTTAPKVSKKRGRKPMSVLDEVNALFRPQRSK